MIRVRILFLIIGNLLTVLGVALLFPMIVDYLHDNQEWHAFATTSFFCIFIGFGIAINCREKNITNISIKEAFIITNLSWITLALFSSLPFYLSRLDLSYSDAFFESMSAITTTGATIIQDLENTPRGILVWRAMLEWIGGIGIIVMALAILPFLNIGGMQLFRTESSDKSDKIIPRTKQLSLMITLIYISLTIICSILLYKSGMTLFDAILHGMTTISTGGFSTHNQSIGYFNSFKIEIIIVFFMFICAIPLPLHIKIIKGEIRDTFSDHQVRLFSIILISSIFITTLWLNKNLSLPFLESFRLSLFNVTAILTTTGYASSDYSLWGEFIITLAFVLCIIGGCTGSTSGGIKIFRLQILYKVAQYQILKLIHPHGVYKIKYNNTVLSDPVITSVLSFLILFCVCFIIISLALSFTGLDFITSLSGAAASLTNIGPGLGKIIGPSGNYASISDSAKWILSFGMLLGRLEIFTIFVILSKQFWKS